MKLSKSMIFFFGALGGLLFGYDTGVIAGAQIFIQEELKLNESQIGFVVSAVLMGAVVGAILISPLADKYGRKIMMMVTAFIFFIGAIGCGLAPDVTILNISRLFLGVAVGGASALVPMYLAELAPAKDRGRLSALNQLMIMIGMLIAYIANYAWQDSPNGWRLMLGFAAVPALILFVGALLLPESPRFLVKKGKVNQALSILNNILTKEEAQKEIHDIEEQNKLANGTFKDVFSKWTRPALVVALGLAIFQQWMGCNTVFYYAPRILMSGGTDAATAIKTQIILGVFYVIVTFFFEGEKDGFFLWTFIFIATYISSFCATWGPVMWIMIGEVFPLKIRGLAVGIASLVNWIANWTVSVSFPVLEKSLGDIILFSIFGTFCIIAALFVKYFVFETRGYTLEEIEQALVTNNTKSLN